MSEIVSLREYKEERLNQLRMDLGRLRRRFFETEDELIEEEIQMTENIIMDLEKELKLQPQVSTANILPDDVYLPPFVVNDINPVLAQSGDTVDWGIAALKIPQIHADFKLTGKGVKVAILDTGAQLDHEDLQGAIIESHNTTSEAWGHSNGHGSGVASLIGARKNDKGILSVAPDCQIIHIKVLKESGSGQMIDIVEGINLAVDRGAQIINMSLGGGATLEALKTAIQRAKAKGIYVISAAGNAGKDDSVGYPGKYPEGYAIAATNQAGKVSAFSSRGVEVDVAAPGERVLAAWRNGGYATVSGTSFSSPVVAGCFALFIEAGITVTEQMLKDTAIDIEDPGKDHKAGYGLINPYELIKRYMKVEEVRCDAPTPVIKDLSAEKVVVEWPEVPNAVGYTPELKTEGSESWNRLSNTKNNEIEISNLSAGTTYDLRIRTNCNNGMSAYSLTTFTTKAAAPEEPQTNPPTTDIDKVRQARQLLNDFLTGK